MSREIERDYQIIAIVLFAHLCDVTLHWHCSYMQKHGIYDTPLNYYHFLI